MRVLPLVVVELDVVGGVVCVVCAASADEVLVSVCVVISDCCVCVVTNGAMLYFLQARRSISIFTALSRYLYL